MTHADATTSASSQEGFRISSDSDFLSLVRCAGGDLVGTLLGQEGLGFRV
jgi:hypothetical protein